MESVKNAFEIWKNSIFPSILPFFILSSLLINYGFDINVILDFIEDFASHSANDNKSPIVMLTTNTSAIMANVKPIA